MMDEQDQILAKQLYDTTRVAELYQLAIDQFERRVAYWPVGLTSKAEIPPEEFERMMDLNLSGDLTKQYNIIVIHELFRKETIFGFGHRPHVFTQNAEGDLLYGAPIYDEKEGIYKTDIGRAAVKMSFDDALNLAIELAISETESFTKSQIRALNMLSLDDFNQIYVAIASRIPVTFSTIYLSSYAVEALQVYGETIATDVRMNTTQDELISRLKMSTFDHVKFCYLDFDLNGTQFKLYPINNFSTYCLEYDMQKVIYDRNQMMQFITNLFESGAGVDFILNSHFYDIVPLDNETVFVDGMREFLQQNFPSWKIDYRKIVLSPFGHLMSYSQLRDAKFDHRLIRYANFEVANGAFHVCIANSKLGETYLETHDQRVFRFKYLFDLYAFIETEGPKIVKGFEKLVKNEQDHLDNYAFLELHKGIMSSKSGLMRHFKKAWKQYLNEDKVRANSIYDQISKIQ